HMAWVEDHWFSHFLLGRDRAVRGARAVSVTVPTVCG
ncbi:MAG: hypothetical protein RJB57_196, partial [Actinomycetota bacterium]